jgi:AraC family ethanolamine operon transcriptional activator
MQTIKGYFTDIDVYNETVKNWDLNFKLLSKSDFSSKLHMVYDTNFSVAKEKLTGKIEQKGKAQEGLIVFGIPVKNASFYWFDKKIKSDTIVIFPKENNFEVISDSNFEVYVVSINEKNLFNAMKKSGIKKNESIFNGKAQELFLSKDFSSRFINLLDYYLNTNLKKVKKNEALINSIIFSLVEYLNTTDQKKTPLPKGKKYFAVKKAVEIINNQINNLFSIPQLCAIVGVSERTLLSAFKEKYKVSPSQYIKAFRLNLVKQEIYNTDTLNISEIAGKYHFWHMGQFTKDFKKQFGLLPSEVNRKIK